MSRDRGVFAKMVRLASFLVFSPYVVLASIGAAGALGHLTGLFEPGPSNDFAALGALSTLVGLASGVISLALTGKTWGPWRILIALLYPPIIVISLLLSGL